MSKSPWGSHTALGQEGRQNLLPRRPVKMSRVASQLQESLPDLLSSASLRLKPIPLGTQSGFPVGPWIMRDDEARARALVDLVFSEVWSPSTQRGLV